MIFLFLFIAVIACNKLNLTPTSDCLPPTTSDCGCWSKQQRNSLLVGLKIKLNDFIVQDGSFNFFNTSDCESLGTCFFQNPSSPYGFIYLPPNPYEGPHTNLTTITKPIFDGSGKSWRLSLDDAVLWLGCTPPTSKYYGWVSYVGSTYRNGDWNNIFGSLGDAANQVRTEFADNCNSNGAFNRNAIWVLSPDKLIVNTIRQKLADILNSTTPVKINVLPVPSGDNGIGHSYWNLKFGLDTTDDTFLAIFRDALPDNNNDWNNYVHNPPISAVRITRKNNAQIHSLNPETPLISRKGTTTEYSLSEALDFLLSLVISSINLDNYNYDTSPTVGAYSIRGIEYGKQCYQRLVNCQGDNRDALYTAVLSIYALGNDSNTGMVYVGINDKAVGTSTYSSLTVYDLVGQVGVMSVTDLDFSGSALNWLKGTKYENLANKFYVYSISYSCQAPSSTNPTSLFTYPYCSIIPTSGYPNLSPGKVGVTLGRDYVNPETGVGPAVYQMVLPTEIRITKK